MPFRSQKQRALFYAAAASGKKAQALRKKMGITKKEAEKMVRHDTGGKLPTHAKRGKR